MSGEAVLIPLVWESITGIAGAVNQTIDARKDAARLQAEEEREQIQAWREFQAQQGAQQQRLRHSRETLRRTHQQLLAGGLNKAARRDLSGPNSAGFVHDHNAATQEAYDLIGLITAELAGIPDELYHDERLAFTRLRRYWRRLQREDSPTMYELLSFRDTLGRTLAAAIRQTTQEAEQHQLLFDSAKRLITEILQTRALSRDAQHNNELHKLQQQLFTLIEDERLSLAAMDVVTTRFHALRDEVHREVERVEMGDFLMQRVAHHLTDMGYARLDGASTARSEPQHGAEFALPQGDRLRVALQPDLRMAFQLSHATSTLIDKTLAGEALEFFRQQEARWCRDMKDLIRRLVKDGVPYEVQFEREIHQDSIPIVAVETADELLDEDHDVRRRRLGKRQRHLT